jgi:hypothetical protein
MPAHGFANGTWNGSCYAEPFWRGPVDGEPLPFFLNFSFLPDSPANDGGVDGLPGVTCVARLRGAGSATPGVEPPAACWLANKAAAWAILTALSR